MFYCAISGEPPLDPVVSTKSGHVYERRLITKYLAENGTDPITGEKLEENDLISVKASPKAAAPRPASMTSIPALLHSLQNEWDALVLETFALKQQYHSIRQELSHALYQQDAATRVVARVAKERDAAREALASVQATLGTEPNAPASDVDMEDSKEAATLPSDILAQVDGLAKSLSATRKKRKVPSGYTSTANVSTFAAKQSIPSLHKSEPAGINSIALSRLQPSIFVTGGNDKIVQIYDTAASKIVASLSGHTKKVHRVAFREDETAGTLVLSASADKTSKIWALDSASGEYAPQHTFKTHKGEVTGLSIHPTKGLFGLCSIDKTYSINDLASLKTIYRSPATGESFRSSAFHPDGLLYALGTTSNAIQIYDIRSGSLAASLGSPASGPFAVSSLSFSENGYHLMAPSSPSVVSIWDLRHISVAASIDLGDDFKANAVKYDTGSGTFLGVVGNKGLRIYQYKTWEPLLQAEGPSGNEIVDLDWRSDGSEVWCVAGREVEIFGTRDDE